MPQLELNCSIGSPFSVRQFRVRDGISKLFSCEIIAVMDSAGVDLEGIVGRAASFAVDTGYKGVVDGRRIWSGVCSYAEQVQGVDGQIDSTSPLSTYLIRVVPVLWLLGQRKSSRIYQRLSVPDIVDRLLAEWNITPIWELDRATHPKFEYRAQYAETDLAFLTRILEEAGISFLLTDRGEKTEVIFTEAPQASTPRPASIVYEDKPNTSAEYEYVTALRYAHEVRPGARTLVDFDFRRPSFRLKGEAEKAAAPESAYEQYEFTPGAFLIESTADGSSPVADARGVYRSEASYGDRMAKQILAGDRVAKRSVQFDTNAIDLSPGTVFKVDNHPHPSLQNALLVYDFELNGTHDGEWDMTMRAVFASEEYRPNERTPKPRATGVQSATVVGPPGEEIHVDEFGRVRVQFPWDREGAFDDDSSCWIRVAQGWAGTGFGLIAPPRIGQEVIVSFIDGDPDQPIIVGRVFNAVNPVPYALPENQTVTGWRTNSSPKTGGFSEMKIDDKAERELFYTRAQRDRHSLVGRDHVERVKRHAQLTVEGSQDVVVQKKRRTLVAGDDHETVKGHKLVQFKKSVGSTIGGDRFESIRGDHRMKVGQTVLIKAGHQIIIESGTRVTLKAPGGSVDVHRGGVDILGTLVRVNSGGTPGEAKSMKPKLPEAATEAEPKDASNDIKD